MEQQPDRATVSIDAFIPDRNGDLVAVGITLAFPKGKGIEAAAAVHSLCHENVGELARGVLLDDATRAHAEGIAFDVLMGKAMRS
jgi:hypothetical protein